MESMRVSAVCGSGQGTDDDEQPRMGDNMEKKRRQELENDSGR